MSKIGVLTILMVLLLAVSVSALSKYYSPIVSGQNLVNERVDPSGFGVIENLILGTTAGTAHRTTFSTCQFAGSGDSDYRYANVDENGLIYLTDDDFINIFDDDCNIVATHTINGTLMSQPFIYDAEGDGFTNIFYISVVGDVSQFNEYEIVNGFIIPGIPVSQIELQDTPNNFCIGLYCDRLTTFGKCATLCNEGNSVGSFRIIDVATTTLEASVDLDDAFSDFGFESIYDEVSDIIAEEQGVNFFTYHDRTFPAIYGMDLDQDGNIEVTAIHAGSGNDIVYNTLDLIDQSMDSEGILIGSAFTPNAEVFSSAGFGQVAQYGSLGSNGEMFVSYALGTGTPPTRMRASVFNSVGGLVKSVVTSSFSTFTSSKISNFAVSDIDGDLKNEYCIAFNNTRHNNKTVIECYSGLTNNIITNCTFSGWATNNPIHISLLGWDTISIRDELITTFGIFELSENNGGVCNNLRPEGFIGLSSASEGVMLPVAVGGDVVFGSADTAVDLIYYGADGARLFKTETIAEQGFQSGELCGGAHIIFCDDFEYQFGLIQRGWQVLERDGEINTSVTPIDFRLNATVDKFQSYVHGTASVDVNYTISTVGEQRRIILSFVHPVVSHSFKLRVTDNNGDIEFRVDDRDTQPSIQIIFNGNDIKVVNDSSPTGESTICTNCITGNQTQSIKITQFFGNDNAKEQGENYPFNISVDKGFYRIFVNNELIGDNIFFTNNASFDAFDWIMTKDRDVITGFTLDDVFSYRGTSQAIDNTDDFFTPIVDDIIFECQIEGLFCAATSECCAGLTCLNNECQGTASELITDTDDNAITQAFRDIPTGGLGFDLIWYIIMFVVGMAVFLGVAQTAGGTAAMGGLIIVEIFLLIMGTLLGFVSPAIIITIVVVGVIVGGFWIRKMSTGSAN